MRWRIALSAVLVLGWLVMLLYLWSAFVTLPSAERLEQTRLMPIPTLQGLALLAARSAAELGGVLVLTAPWWRRLYALRLLAAAVLLAAWFFATTPLSLSAMHWVHRRWLAAMIVGLLGCAIIAGATRLLQPAAAKGS
jgi:hypothetical protein